MFESSVFIANLFSASLCSNSFEFVASFIVGSSVRFPFVSTALFLEGSFVSFVEIFPNAVWKIIIGEFDMFQILIVET